MGQVVEFSKIKRKTAKIDLSNVAFTFYVNVLKTCKSGCIEITYSETRNNRNKWAVFVEARDLEQMEQLKHKAIKQLRLKQKNSPTAD